MSYYNGQIYYGDQFSDQYPQENTPPGHSIQVQVPKLYPDQIKQQNLLSVRDNQVSAPFIQPHYLQQIPGHGQQRGATSGQILTSTPTSNHAQNYGCPGTVETPPDAQIPPTDYQLLLLSLAEDYFAAAYGSGSMKELVKRELQNELYYKLIATGLGCLEVSLRKGKFQPNVEAAAQFRYASILFQETENYMEAEEALSKGISICERHRLHDMKYNMQHLLARVMFATNPKASLRFLDSIIKDIEVYQHISWIYAFRLLRASLSIQLSSPQDSFVAISHLKIVATLAKDHSDNAVSAVASAYEAMIHLLRSNSAETIEQAQRALAAARSSQLDPAAQRIPQLSAMLHFIDISCSMQHWDPPQATTKMQAMQTMLDATSTDHQWTDDGVVYVPISHKTAQTLPGSGSMSGIVEADDSGNLALLIQWLPKEETYALGYLLSAAVVSHRNAMDGQKSEQYLKEAIRMTGGMMDLSTCPLSTSISRQLWRKVFLCQVEIQLIFALCSRTAWTTAKEHLLQLKQIAADLPDEPIDTIGPFMNYLEGLICQGTGDIVTALSIYQSPLLALPGSGDASPPNQIRRDISILSALNTLFIIRSPTHPSHSLMNSLLSTLEPLALSNPSKNIHSAYHLVRATSHPDDRTGIVKTKQYLQSALQAAKHCANNQLMCITLNFMSWKFFRGVVAEQAEKSAVASQSLAKKGRDSLWTSVADGVLADTLDMQGKGAEAEAVRKEGREIAGRLPLVMQREVEGSGEARDGDG